MERRSPRGGGCGLSLRRLEELARERVPLQWAATQNNLGVRFQRLGERERGRRELEEAVAAFREALKEFARAGPPLDWEVTQSNLAVALAILGERENANELDEAIAVYREAHTE